LILYRAAWILPIVTPPVRGGWVLTSGGRVIGSAAFADQDSAGFGGPRAQDAGAEGGTAVAGQGSIETIDLGDVAVLPGLVNAHTHLELSWMRGRIPPSDSMPAWASRLLALRRDQEIEPSTPIVEAIREVRAAGTALVGDVTNTLAPYDLLADSELGAAIFKELLGFNVASPEQIVAAARSELARLMPLELLRPSIVPHAPYSVSPALFRAIARAAGDRPLSVHVGESLDEMEFLRDGTGAWRELLGRLGAWNEGWESPGCGPVEYLDRLGLLNARLLAVHGTQLDDGELARLAAAGATLVTCLRSNRWTGAGTPPIDRFYRSGVRLAIGTDSLASVEDLNLFQELAEVRRLVPQVPARRLLESATISGAAALGFAEEFGTIEPGKRADLIAVRVPRATEDVEEYLLSGIEPDAIRWLS
jgi:cytosine/adenosine deaminase-related metal-dependent hydrolase